MIELGYFLYSTAFVAAAMLMLYIAKSVFDLATPFKLKVQMTEQDNPAVGIVLCGYLLGVIAVLAGSFIGEGEGSMDLDGFLNDMGPTAFYGLLGMSLLFLAGMINDKLILRQFSNTGEVINKKNVSVAVIIAASYLGSGLIIAGSLRGGEDILSVIVFFLIAQTALVLFAIIYQKATSYDDQKELGEHKNLACGLAFAGNLLAYSILLMKAGTMDGPDGEVIVLLERFQFFAYYAISGAILLPLLRFINDIAFLPEAKLTVEIERDRNINAGLLEASLAVGMAVVLIITL